jgi:hypothetical protein
MPARRLGLIVLTMLSLSATAGPPPAPAPACIPVPASAIVSLKELPPEVRKLLEQDSRGRGGIADAGEKFNATDVIMDAAIPQTRFVAATASDDCASVTVERGGRGYSVQVLTFARTGKGWELMPRAYGR